MAKKIAILFYKKHVTHFIHMLTKKKTQIIKKSREQNCIGTVKYLHNECKYNSHSGQQVKSMLKLGQKDTDNFSYYYIIKAIQIETCIVR